MANIMANIFGSSPVKPLEKHVEIAYRCTSELNSFFAAVVQENWQKAAKVRGKIAALEHEADDIKKQIRMHLPKSLFMPVPREDLLELLLVQDKAANQAKDVSGLITGRSMEFPGPLAELLPAYVKRCEDACEQAMKVINELDELVETGFAGKEVELVASIINELDGIEKDTDKQQIKIRASLMKIEKELPPVDVMFYYKVIEGIGGVADIAQRIGSRVELLLAK